MSAGLRLSEDEARVIIARLSKATGRNPMLAKEAVKIDEQIPGARRRGRCRMGPSPIELMFAQQLAVLEIPAPARNLVFLPGRKFELDFAWPDRRFGVEVDGMAHRTKERFKKDFEKHALAMIHGWRVLRVGGHDVRSGRAAAWLITLWEQR